MDTNLKQIAHQLLDLIQSDDGKVDIDSTDKEPSDVVENKVTFNMSKDHDRVVPGRRGPGSRVPLGRITYKVTIEATYEPFDDE
jgi:hypothetical protein